MFGGFSTEGVWLNDMHVLDTAFRQTFVPPLRAQHQSSTSASASSSSSSSALTATPSSSSASFSSSRLPASASSTSSEQLMLLWYQPDVSGEPPSPRAAHTATVVGPRIYIFGGNDGQQVYNDVHYFDTEHLEWHHPVGEGELPPARAGHTATYLGQGQFLVFGGASATQAFNDLYVFNTCKFERKKKRH